jgi:hypothetical protein
MPAQDLQVAGPWIVARDLGWEKLVVGDVETGQLTTTTLPRSTASG